MGNFAFTQWFTKTVKTILIVLNIVTWTSAKSLSKDIPVHELNVQMYHYCLLGNFSGLKEGKFWEVFPIGKVTIGKGLFIEHNSNRLMAHMVLVDSKC